MERMIFVLLMAMLAGCATVPDDFKHEMQGKYISNPTEGKAALVIIRPEAFKGSVASWAVSVDGRGLSRLVLGSYVVKEVDPGEHWISQTNSNVTPKSVKCEAGKTYFYDYEIGLVGGAIFTELPEETARNMTEKYIRTKSFY